MAGLCECIAINAIRRWQDFANALRSMPYEEFRSVSLGIVNIQLPKQILRILEPALKVAPIDHLILFNNRLRPDGIRFVTNVLEANPHVEAFSLVKDDIDWGLEAYHLIEAAREHPSLRYLELKHCDIAQAILFRPEIVPSLLSFEAVLLDNNSIGGCGALSLISNCLATDPPSVRSLKLDHNMLNDEDAALIANSLKTNTNLDDLSLCGNNFTDVGIKILYKAVYDDTSLNTITDSNHTCELVLFGEDGPVARSCDKEVLSMNGKTFEQRAFPGPLLKRCLTLANGDTDLALRLLDSEVRKKMKILHALAGQMKYLEYLNGMSLILVPKVLAFIEECGKYSGKESRSLDLLFHIVSANPEVHIIPQCS